MSPITTSDLSDFVRNYRGMAIRPKPGSSTALKGLFAFVAIKEGLPKISDSYDLSILVPETFPRDLPRVTETAGRIPRDGKHHINPDGTLCLGTPLRLLRDFSKIPTLVGFAEIFLVPYLYAVSLKLDYGIPFVFGELEHGGPGELADYADMLGLKSPEQAKRALTLLAQKKRRANKFQCPCGCGLRLGRCHFNYQIGAFRKIASRSLFKSIVERLK